MCTIDQSEKIERRERFREKGALGRIQQIDTSLLFQRNCVNTSMTMVKIYKYLRKKRET